MKTSASELSLDMQLVIRGGDVLACVGARRFYLAPALEARPADDALRMLVCALCTRAIAETAASVRPVRTDDDIRSTTWPLRSPIVGGGGVEAEPLGGVDASSASKAS